MSCSRTSCYWFLGAEQASPPLWITVLEIKEDWALFRRTSACTSAPMKVPCFLSNSDRCLPNLSLETSSDVTLLSPGKSMAVLTPPAFFLMSKVNLLLLLQSKPRSSFMYLSVTWKKTKHSFLLPAISKLQPSLSSVSSSTTQFQFFWSPLQSHLYRCLIICLPLLRTQRPK